jgi:hypothetical protein
LKLKITRTLLIALTLATAAIAANSLDALTMSPRNVPKSNFCGCNGPKSQTVCGLRYSHSRSPSLPR